MMFQGSNQVAAQYYRRGEPRRPRLLPLPGDRPGQYGQDYMDAPTDGFMLSKKAKNQDAAKALLEYIGTGEAEALVPQDRPVGRRPAPTA